MKLFLRIASAFGITVILAAVVVFISFRIADWEQAEITDELRLETGQSYVRLSDGITEYEIAGPDSGQVVVFVSGASVPYYIFDGTFEHVANAGFRVIRYNYFGRGFSDRPFARYTADLYDRQLSELIDSLHLETPVDLVGLSMGGLVTAQFVARHKAKVRRLVLIDPAHRRYPPPAQPEWLAHLMFVFAKQEETAQSQLIDFLDPSLFPNWVERYKPQMQFKGFRHSRISTAYHFSSIDHPAHFRQLRDIGIPVLLVWGEKDITVPFSESRVVLDATAAEFLPVSDSGHLPHLEKPEFVNGAISSFLLRVLLKTSDEKTE